MHAQLICTSTAACARRKYDLLPVVYELYKLHNQIPNVAITDSIATQ